MSEITNFRGEAVPATAETQGEAAVAALISRVGERVRKARELKGIPRRVLSEVSGVSPRYLALLEAGEGNISIGLLQRVAEALDHRIEWLLGEDDPWTSDALRVTEMFRAATAETRAKVLEVLAPHPETSTRQQRIALIGLRGAGKSTLGALVGAELGLPFVELNREIEEQSGMPVTEVMAFYGHEGYRRLEAQALSRIVATHDSMILAVAGGIVTDPDVFKALLTHFHTIWIKASPADHMARVRAQGDMRPMANNPEAMEQLKHILTSRETLYDQAQAKLETTGRTVSQSVEDLVALIAERGFLD
ncbi:helix-turn-helix transcriptional regulator [Pararhodobacter sp.]|uniref:helix-turn-helix transcriptional regulator n=1 Tax=Pararhodobacter sp. TaxID=2127056 RepID=UPI002AFE6ABA|nr:helix-turn-helix transcriptional regulator [Pararhodobacter sp.]